MHVLLLGPNADKLAPVIERGGDMWSTTTSPLDSETADWLVSFGYRHVIREPHLTKFPERIVNIHISMLPWNRGADPNFWSWFDRTPKGVSIHRVEAGIDTGPVLAQVPVEFVGPHTLRTSYDLLVARAQDLFAQVWARIRRGDAEPLKTEPFGSHHRTRDKDPFWSRLTNGYDTPVDEIEKLGAAHGACRQFWDRG